MSPYVSASNSSTKSNSPSTLPAPSPVPKGISMKTYDFFNKLKFNLYY